jgi:hypothetical protein
MNFNHYTLAQLLDRRAQTSNKDELEAIKARIIHLLETDHGKTNKTRAE